MAVRETFCVLALRMQIRTSQLHRITIYRILVQTLFAGPVSTPGIKCSLTGLPFLFLKARVSAQ
jgi:hypothetical protein